MQSPDQEPVKPEAMDYYTPFGRVKVSKDQLTRISDCAQRQTAFMNGTLTSIPSHKTISYPKDGEPDTFEMDDTKFHNNLIEHSIVLFKKHNDKSRQAFQQHCTAFVEKVTEQPAWGVVHGGAKPQ